MFFLGGDKPVTLENMKNEFEFLWFDRPFNLRLLPDNFVHFAYYTVCVITVR